MTTEPERSEQPIVAKTRDARAIEALDVRLKELVAAFRVNGHQERGSTYVFWSDISREIEAGAFDDLLVLL